MVSQPLQQLLFLGIETFQLLAQFFVELALVPQVFLQVPVHDVFELAYLVQFHLEVLLARLNHVGIFLPQPCVLGRSASG